MPIAQPWLEAPWGWLVLGVVLGIGGSAIFTVLDLAIFALTDDEIETLKRDRKSRVVHALVKARNDFDRSWFALLAGALFFNLVFAISLGWMVVAFFQGVGFLPAFLAWLLGTWLLLFFGEVAPGLFASRWRKSLAPFSAQCLRLVSPLLWPLYYPPLSLLRLGGSFFNLNKHERETMVAVEKRLLGLIGLGKVDVCFEEDEREMIDHALEFGERSARDIMTDRADLEGISQDKSQEEALEAARKSRFSRLLVYDNSLDNVVGIVHAKQLLLWPEKNYHDLLTPPLFVTEDTDLLDLMALMKKKQRQIVVVLDEYGMAIGIVSMNNLLEALVGPEQDEEEEPA